MEAHEATPREQAATAAAAISREVIALTKSLTGRGPTKAKTYVETECVVVLMRDAHTVSEGTLAEGGRERDVAQSRVDLSEDAKQGFVEIIERHTGRKVVGFMSGSQQDPSMLADVFVLDTSPLLSAVDEPADPQAGGSG